MQSTRTPSTAASAVYKNLIAAVFVTMISERKAKWQEAITSLGCSAGDHYLVAVDPSAKKTLFVGSMDLKSSNPPQVKVQRSVKTTRQTSSDRIVRLNNPATSPNSAAPLRAKSKILPHPTRKRPRDPKTALRPPAPGRAALAARMPRPRQPPRSARSWGELPIARRARPQGSKLSFL